MASIGEIQDEIVDEFALLDGDREMTNFYIMEMGQKMDEMPDEEKKEDNLVKGCQSKVWLTARIENGNVHYQADSNAAITKGLVSMLVRILSDQKAEKIISAELDFPARIHMDRFIGTQRSNGFAAMIKQMKYYAIALKSREEINK